MGKDGMPEKAPESGKDLAAPALKRTPLRRLVARLPFGIIGDRIVPAYPTLHAAFQELLLEPVP
jgi:hypothetical protein